MVSFSRLGGGGWGLQNHSLLVVQSPDAKLALKEKQRISFRVGSVHKTTTDLTNLFVSKPINRLRSRSLLESVVVTRQNQRGERGQ